MQVELRIGQLVGVLRRQPDGSETNRCGTGTAHEGTAHSTEGIANAVNLGHCTCSHWGNCTCCQLRELHTESTEEIAPDVNWGNCTGSQLRDLHLLSAEGTAPAVNRGNCTCCQLRELFQRDDTNAFAEGMKYKREITKFANRIRLCRP